MPILLSKIQSLDEITDTEYETTIDAGALDAAGVRSVEFIEGEPTPEFKIKKLEGWLMEERRAVNQLDEQLIERDARIKELEAQLAKANARAEAAESQLAGWKMCPKCGRVVALVYPNHSPNPEDIGICWLSLRPVGVMPDAR